MIVGISDASLVGAFLVSTAGYIFARRLYQARNNDSHLSAVEAIRVKLRFIPMGLAFIGLAPWLFVMINVSEAGFEQGPVLYVIDTGLGAASLWLGIRFFRMRVREEPSKATV